MNDMTNMISITFITYRVTTRNVNDITSNQRIAATRRRDREAKRRGDDRMALSRKPHQFDG